LVARRLIAAWANGCADEFLVFADATHVGGIEKVDA
jgi:hypothetical protein